MASLIVTLAVPFAPPAEAIYWCWPNEGEVGPPTINRLQPDGSCTSLPDYLLPESVEELLE